MPPAKEIDLATKSVKSTAPRRWPLKSAIADAGYPVTSAADYWSSSG
jgi:hypothetical protein